MLHTWLRQPFNLRLLKTALTTASPVLSQVKQSFYVFTLNLPWGLANLFATFGNYWFLRLLHHVQAGVLSSKKGLGRKLDDKELADWLAISSGPGAGQFEGEKSSSGYGQSVLARSKNHGMGEKIRYYQDGLLTTPWEKSLETIVALSELQDSSSPKTGLALFDEGPPGSIKVPATVIYGKYDVALERRLALEGISDYLTRGKPSPAARAWRPLAAYRGLRGDDHYQGC